MIFDFDDAIMYSANEPEKEHSPRKYNRPFERTVKLSDLVIAGMAVIGLTGFLLDAVLRWLEGRALQWR